MKAPKNKAEQAAKPVAALPPGTLPTLHLIGLAFAALLIVLYVYSPALNGPFVFDDEYLPFRDPGFLKNGVGSMSPMARPFMNYSFWWNLKLFGEDPYSFHVFNVILHWMSTGILFLALRKLLEMGGVVAWRDWLAVFGSAVFLLHPINTESVAYVAGRSEGFSLPLFLGAYTIFLYRRPGGIDWLGTFGVIVLFVCAIFSKEHTAVLPGLLFLTDICFPEGTVAQTLRRNWRLHGPIIVVGAVSLYLVYDVLRQARTAGFQMADLPWNHYFYTQWLVIWVYIRLYLLPVGQNADWDYPVSRSITDHGAILGLIGIVALLVVAFRYRRRYPLAFFGLLAFALLIAPTSSVVPIRDTLAERRLYLPFIGLLLITCEFVRRWNTTTATRAGTLATVLLALGYMTSARSAVWGDPYLLWKDATEKNPANSRAHFHLAMVHYERQECPEALKKFDDAAKVGKPDYSMLIDWGLALDCANQQDQALMKFREAQKIENSYHVHSLMGMVLAKQNKPGLALDELNEAVHLNPNYDMTFLYRGNVYLQMNQFDQAEADYNTALKLKPGDPNILQAIELLKRRRSGAR